MTSIVRDLYLSADGGIRRRNRYLSLQRALLFRMLRNGYITPKKITNAAIALFRYLARSDISSAYPILMNFETWNECNANCTFCRALDGRIYDHNPSGDGVIQKGQMELEDYKKIIDEVKESLLIAVPYVNGEPLLYKDLFNAIKFTSDRKIATIISTNGMPLNARNSEALIRSRLTFIKIAISGMTQETHKIQSRLTNIDRILKNVEQLCQIKNDAKSDLVVMLDFMEYDYNRHEVAIAEGFCNRLKIMFNVRPGNLHMSTWGEGIGSEPAAPPSTNLCDFPWFAVTVDWDKKLYPCCDHVSWSQANPIDTYTGDSQQITNIWNGNFMRNFRRIHTTKGRGSIDICKNCHRSGLAFKE